MDINIWRGIATIVVMIGFIAICWWAFSPKRKQRFRDAAQLPFEDEPAHQRKVKQDSKKVDDEKNSAE